MRQIAVFLLLVSASTFAYGQNCHNKCDAFQTYPVQSCCNNVVYEQSYTVVPNQVINQGRFYPSTIEVQSVQNLVPTTVAPVYPTPVYNSTLISHKGSTVVSDSISQPAKFTSPTVTLFPKALGCLNGKCLQNP